MVADGGAVASEPAAGKGAGRILAVAGEGTDTIPGAADTAGLRTQLSFTQQDRDKALSRVTLVAQASDEALVRLDEANKTRDEANKARDEVLSLLRGAREALADSEAREATLRRKVDEDAERIERMQKGYRRDAEPRGNAQNGR